MNVEMILAVDRVGGMGKDGRLPWPHCKSDMKRFSEITKGAICVMGRLTYNDIAAAAIERGRTEEDIRENGILKGRTAVVLSSSQTEFIGATTNTSLRGVFNQYKDTPQRVIVIGGAALFIEASSCVNIIHVTAFDQTFKCDVFFPTKILESNEFAMSGEKVETDLDYTTYFLTYTRRRPINIR